MSTQPPDRDPLTAERAAEIEAEVAIDAMFASPVRLPVRFKAMAVTIELDPLTGQTDVPGVALTTQTPQGEARLVLTRDEAITMASGLKKAAHRGLSTPGAN